MNQSVQRDDGAVTEVPAVTTEPDDGFDDEPRVLAFMDSPVPVGRGGTPECCCQAVDLTLTQQRTGSTAQVSNVRWTTKVVVTAKTEIKGDASAELKADAKCKLRWEEFHTFAQTDDKGLPVAADKWLVLSDPPFSFAILDPIKDGLKSMTCGSGTKSSGPTVDEPAVSSAPGVEGGTAIWGVVTLISGKSDAGCDGKEIKRYFYTASEDGKLFMYPAPPKGKPSGDPGVDDSTSDKPPFPDPPAGKKARAKLPSKPTGARDVST